jgi:hypothetical protein
LIGENGSDVLGDTPPPKSSRKAPGFCIHNSWDTQVLEKTFGYVVGHPKRLRQYKDGQSIRGSLRPDLCPRPFVDDKTTWHIPVG